MSDPEYTKQWWQEHKHPCLDCGKPVSHTATRCGSCNAKWLWRCGKLNATSAQRGDKHHSWKGGKFQKDGYWFILRPDHPRAKDGYVRGHILAWEEANGRPLPKGWIVHHLNGIRGDDRPVNLVAMPSRKHSLVLQAKAKRIQELEALLNNQHQLL